MVGSLLSIRIILRTQFGIITRGIHDLAFQCRDKQLFAFLNARSIESNVIFQMNKQNRHKKTCERFFV